VVSFEKLLRPASVAVVGASADPLKVGHAVLSNLIGAGFTGPIYPVNPRAGVLLGRQAYPSLKDIPGEVDLAVIIVRRESVLQVLRDCAAKGVSAVVTITAGFGETGEDGRRLQREVAQVVRQHQLTMLGPNCLGLINPWHRLNAAFGQGLGEAGPIALISQSGALITAIQDMAARSRLGFSLMASLGNKATLDEVDFLEHLQGDERTRVITAYLEDISRGQEFMNVAERVGKVKPIVVIKAGRTTTGARAASSHTGSLAGSDSAYDSAFERTGVIRVDSVEQLFDLAGAFAYQPLPRGPRVGVVTNAGGPGIMMSDALELAGLTVASLDEATVAALRQALPPAAAVRNPVDVLGDADGERYGAAAELILASPAVDSLIVILTPQRMTDSDGTARALAAVAARHDKPVLACFMGAASVRRGVILLKQHKIPQFFVPERAARTLAHMVRYEGYQRRPLRVVDRFAVNRNPVIKLLKACAARGEREIGESDAMTVMEAYHFDVPPRVLATSAAEAVRFAEEVGYPLAMKISSPDILHKSDVGGVRVNLTSAAQVEDAFDLLMLRIGRQRPEATLRGVLIEKMIPGGKEVILGMKKDPQFGPVLMFGLGGIFVEVLRDVAFALAPITEEEGFAMLERTRSYKLLTGVRGEKPLDLRAIVTGIQRLSQLVMDFHEIEEVDINPLKVGQEGDGAFVVDARIILRRGDES
jgi:acetyl coenzyme A synthetase (ADP forming)-like protein